MNETATKWANAPRVFLVQAWEGDEGVAVNGRVVYRFPDDGLIPQTAENVAECVARALDVPVEFVDLTGQVEDWDDVPAALAPRLARGGQDRGLLAARYAAARLYLMITALCRGQETPNDVVEDWAWDTLEEAVPESHLDKLLDEARSDHATMLAGATVEGKDEPGDEIVEEPVYWVDVPDPHDPGGYWHTIGTFQCREEAVRFVRDVLGGDAEGRIHVITEGEDFFPCEDEDRGDA